jgi:hypothetical protein
MGLLAGQLRIFERRGVIRAVQVIAGGPWETSSREDSSTGCMGLKRGVSKPGLKSALYIILGGRGD